MNKNVHTYIIPFGRKYRGVHLTKIPFAEIKLYMQWLEENHRKRGMHLNSEAIELKQMIELWASELFEYAEDWE